MCGSMSVFLFHFIHKSHCIMSQLLVPAQQLNLSAGRSAQLWVFHRWSEPLSLSFGHDMTQGPIEVVVTCINPFCRWIESVAQPTPRAVRIAKQNKHLPGIAAAYQQGWRDCGFAGLSHTIPRISTNYNRSATHQEDCSLVPDGIRSLGPGSIGTGQHKLLLKDYSCEG